MRQVRNRKEKKRQGEEGQESFERWTADRRRNKETGETVRHGETYKTER